MAVSIRSTKWRAYMVDLAIWTLLLLPLPLLAVAWSKSRAPCLPLTVVTLSTFLLLSAEFRSLKLMVFGEDYSDRLYLTMGLNVFLAVMAGLDLAVNRKWIATAAAIILALGWILMCGINSTV
jgi:hypothetical protein